MSHQVISFQDLNDDVLLKIFDYLSFVDICAIHHQDDKRINITIEHYFHRRYSKFDYVKEFESIPATHLLNNSYAFEILGNYIKILLILAENSTYFSPCLCVSSQNIDRVKRFRKFLKFFLKYEQQLHTIQITDINNQGYSERSNIHARNSSCQHSPSTKQLFLTGVYIENNIIEYICYNWRFQELYFDKYTLQQNNSRHACSCKLDPAEEFIGTINGITTMTLNNCLTNYSLSLFCQNNVDTMKKLTINLDAGSNNNFSIMGNIGYFISNTIYLNNLEELEITNCSVLTNDKVIKIANELKNLTILKLIGMRDINAYGFIRNLAVAKNNLKELLIKTCRLNRRPTDLNDLNLNNINRFTFTKLERLTIHYTIDNLALLQIPKLNQSLNYICFALKIENCNVLVKFVELATELKCMGIQLTGLDENVMKKLGTTLQEIDNAKNLFVDGRKLEIKLDLLELDFGREKHIGNIEKLKEIVSMFEFEHFKNVVVRYMDDDGSENYENCSCDFCLKTIPIDLHEGFRLLPILGIRRREM